MSLLDTVLSESTVRAIETRSMESASTLAAGAYRGLGRNVTSAQAEAYAAAREESRRRSKVVVLVGRGHPVEVSA